MGDRRETADYTLTVFELFQPSCVRARLFTLDTVSILNCSYIKWKSVI